MHMKVRTRNAPSPTGYAHVGTIYQSMINKAYATRNNGHFILRIEDTDRDRYVEGAVDAIYEGLEWANIIPDESSKHGGGYGPYVQSERLSLYKKYAQDLVDKGFAYYCFCSEERLAQVREDKIKNKIPPMYDKHCRNLTKTECDEKINNKEKYVIRMKVPENTKIKVTDLLRGDIEFDSSTIDDQILLKSDGYATYHLAVVVDDHLMEISHAVRGQEWITSFPKHKLLYDYFGWSMPVFVHTPMLTSMEGAKLGKRHGHTSVDWYRRQGFLSEAVLNFLALLGWSHPVGKEIFSFEEYIKLFDLKDLSPISPKFDLVKLEWMNGQYIQSLNSTDIVEKIKEWLLYCQTSKYKGATEYQTHWTQNDYKKLLEFINNIKFEDQRVFADMNKQRIKKFEDLIPLNSFFINEKPIDLKLLTKYKAGNELKDHLIWVRTLIESTKEWDLNKLKEIEIDIKNRAAELNWKILEVFYPIRIAICYDPVSPPLFDSIYLLGKEKTLSRLGTCIDNL
jgi:glutamyl-tRNA synthetase